MSLHADARTLNGISGPFGYFDPSGLAASVTPAQVKRYRESELTHGRVCMLAATGMLTGEAIQDNKLLLNFDGHIQGPAIMHFQQIEHGFWEPLVLFIGTPSTHCMFSMPCIHSFTLHLCLLVAKFCAYH